MRKTDEIRRIDSILRLQKKLSGYQPGSYLFEIYDKAIDLAMSDERKIDDYFYYNLLRDARRIISRQRKVMPAFVELYEPAYQDEDGSRERNPFVSDYFTPEQSVIHSNLITSLSGACVTVHKYAPLVLSDMTDGLTIKESSLKNDLTESMVKKLRVEIKSLATQILFN